MIENPWPKLAIPSAIVWNEVDGELVLFHAGDGRYHALNGVASAIWRRLAQGQGWTDIVAELARTYDREERAIAEDVRRFIQVMIEQGLLLAETGEGP